MNRMQQTKFEGEHFLSDLFSQLNEFDESWLGGRLGDFQLVKTIKLMQQYRFENEQ